MYVYKYIEREIVCVRVFVCVCESVCVNNKYNI